MKVLIILITLISLPFFGAVNAGEVDVLKVDITKIDENVFIFRVTVTHQDEGWEHYADKWEIVSPESKVLGARILLHPHVDEQPFTRALAGVKIPKGIEEVTVRAHDTIHKYGGKTVRIALPK